MDRNCVVVDSCVLQSEKLRHFFEQQETNFAVLPDLVWYEIYKQKTLASILDGLSVIGDFPEQIIGLKSTEEIASLDPREPFSLEAMQYTAFPDRIRETMVALTGPARNTFHVWNQLDIRWENATSRHQSMLAGTEDLMISLPEMAEQMFSANELKIIRSGKNFSHDMVSTVMGSAEQIWETLIEGNSYEPSDLSVEGKQNSYWYRFSVAFAVYSLWWMSKGNQSQRIEKANNDIIDLHIAVYATYYNGLATFDKKAHLMYSQVAVLLSDVGVRVPSVG